jgi:phosphatidylglycerophosphate synthase
MVSVGRGAAAAVVALVALLVLAAAAYGLAVAAWVVGLGCGLALVLVLVRGTVALGPADVVTLSRAVLACLLAALVAESLTDPWPVAVLFAVSVTALVLDAVDGQVARRTRTSSSFGARFDGEADAFLILVLSVAVATSYGAWVLAIGLARYAFLVAGLLIPRLRGRLPPRYWRKVVAATQGIVLTGALAGVTPRPVTYAALVVALVLLAESFGRDVVWLCQHDAPRRVAVGS